MTASDTPPPLTDEELQQYRELIDMHRQYGPALSIEGEAHLLAEVDRLRSMKCATCGKRIGYLNHKGHLLGWGCADGDECAENAMAAEVDQLRAALATVSDEAGVQCREAAARAVRAEKERDEARPELADWMHATAEARRERDALAAKLAAVGKLHWEKSSIEFDNSWCFSCGDNWPCPTAAALGETGGTEQ